MTLALSGGVGPEKKVGEASGQTKASRFPQTDRAAEPPTPVRNKSKKTRRYPMKTRTLAVFVVAAFLAVTAGYAQSTTTLVGKIPFEFRVGNSVLPAGDYEVIPSSTPRALLIRCFDAKAAVIALPNAAERLHAPKDSTLVFNRYGDTYFLSQVWHGGNNRGYALPKSKTERETAKNASGTQLAYIPVVVR
jgi:hypothetical protein